MKKTSFMISLAVVFCFFTGVSHGEEKIRIAGSGSMIALLNELAKGFMAENKNAVIEINQKSIESTGGIMSAAEGKVDIGMTARSLKEDEKKLGLQTFEIARVATVIGVNKSVTLKEISSDNLCRIYTGKIAKWKDLGDGGKIVPLTRPDRDATKDTVRKNIACFRDLKEPETVVIIPTAPEMSKILANRPDTIGFTDSVAVDDSAGSIVAVKLDGMAPTTENVRSGAYKIIKNNILVTKGQPDGAVKDFITYIKGPKGARIIEANKAVPVK